MSLKDLYYGPNIRALREEEKKKKKKELPPYPPYTARDQALGFGVPQEELEEELNEKVKEDCSNERE